MLPFLGLSTIPFTCSFSPVKCHELIYISFLSQLFLLTFYLPFKNCWLSYIGITAPREKKNTDEQLYLYGKFIFQISLFSNFKFLIGGYLLYSILLASVILQYESAIGIHMTPSSWTFLSTPTPHNPNSFSMSTGLSLSFLYQMQIPTGYHFAYGNV